MAYVYPQGQQQQTVIIPGGTTTAAYGQPYGQAYVAQPYAAGGLPMGAGGLQGGYVQQPMMATTAAGGMGQPAVTVIRPGGAGGVGTQFAVGGATPLGLAGAGLQGGVGAGLGTGLQGQVGAGGHLGPFTAQSSFGAGIQPGLGHHQILPGGGYYAGGGYPYGGY